MTEVHTGLSSSETMDLTPIQSFFSGKSVFITGGTGFLGKVLIEKLLRSCPGLKTIYIVVRTKKGKAVDTRVNDMVVDTLFDEVRKKNPKFAEQIVALPGDCLLPGLGMSDEHKQLLSRNVNVFFHVAASVRFDENLKTAVKINVNATQEALDLARSMKNLESFVYVSTAYSFCYMKIIKEEVYDWSSCYEEVLKFSKEMSEEEIEAKTPSILGNWPNTYTMTKAFAENLVKKTEGKLPVCIFRPAIVTSTASEPVQGWVDNMLGPTGIILGAGCGVVRAVHCNMKAEANLVPVDLVINAMLAVARTTAVHFRNNDSRVKVYNFVSSTDNPLTYEEFESNLYKYGNSIPSDKAIWYYYLILCNSKSLTYFLWLFLHWLPAFLIDAGAIVSGKKPRMMKLYHKVHKMIRSLGYFATRSWVYETNNIHELWNKTSDEDKRLFNFDVKTINWDTYLKHYIKGARLYVLKEDMSTLEEALKKWNRLYWYHQIVKLSFGVLCFSIVWICCQHVAAALV